MMKTTFSVFLTIFLVSSSLLAQDLRPAGEQEFPRFVKLESSVNVSQRNSVFAEYFDMTTNDELRSIELKTDELGMVHEKFQQFHKGVKVEGGTYSLHMQNGNIKHMTGFYLDVKDLNVTPTIAASGAFANAVAYVGASKYMWEGLEAGEHLDYKKPAGELVIIRDINDKGIAKLAYKFDIYASDPIYRANVFIDAHSGAFITEHARIHDANVAATGNSLYNGNVSFTADNSSGPFRLRQTASGGGVETYDLNNGTNYNNASDITSGSTNFTGNETGVQAHYGAEQTYDYFFTDHGRNSYNGSGAVLRSYVSYSSNYVNAFWDGSRMTYGDGDGVNYGPLVSLDITGHEIAHGVTEFSADLVYQRESGALNESFSDIFGEMVEYHALGSNDWQMGTDIGIGGSGALRSMNNPNAFNDPDTYGGSFWTNPQCGTPTQSNDYCGVHSNSGVQNKWFYILAIGESGTNDIGNPYNVTGLGRTKAAAIAYRNLTQYLSVNSTFADARAGAIQSAVDLYGSGSAEEIATTNAWYAVGVGGEYGTISYCNSNGNNVNDEYIQRVQLGTIDNSNTSSPSGGYTNYTSISTDLTKSSNYTITITPLWTGTVYAEGYSVWIDYNQDGDFTDSGEQVYTQGATTSTPVSGSFTVPSTATDGPTRMRVSMKYNAIPTACESFTYGEVEDYTVNITGGGGGDTQAPSVPNGLASSNIAQTSFTLSWNASSDNVGVTGYTVYLNGSSIGTVSGTAANITGLTASTTYSMTVDAFDAAGNNSAQSSALNVTTSSASDTQAPSVPNGLASSNITTSSFDVSWNASSDNVAVTGYNVYLNGSLDGTTAGTSYSFSGLSAATNYSVTVSAYDAAGNTSAQSSALSVTTLTGGGGGTTTISANFFETGWEDWNDGGSDCARISGSNAYEGNYAIRIRDNSGSSVMTTDPFNLAGYNSIDVEFFFRPVGMENGEDFWLQYNDGSGFTTVGVWTVGSGGVSNNNFYTSTVTLSSANYNFVNGGQFRFRNDASVNNDRIYIDAVTITGTTSSIIAGISGQTTQLVSSPNGAEMGLVGASIEGDIVVYPNPSTDIINVQVTDGIESVRVFSATGALMNQVTEVRGQRSETSRTLNISQLAAGIYFISIQTEEEVLYQKFVKE